MIEIFGRDEFVATFGRTFLSQSTTTPVGKDSGEVETNALRVNQFYNRLAMDCLESLPVFVEHLGNVKQALDGHFERCSVWQLKLLRSLMERGMLKENPAEMIRAQQLRIEMMLEDEEGKGGEFRQQLQQSYSLEKEDLLTWLGTLKQADLSRLLFAREFRGEDDPLRSGVGGDVIARWKEQLK